ncbi:MAG: ribonuclease [Pseudonocardiales bacterium]|nr:ribonuclease [Pseudonocardiales bacterium]
MRKPAAVRKPAAAVKPAAARRPTLRYEREAWRSGAGLLAAIDEVGRGALAGPVSVGVVLLSSDTKPAPLGVADSKLLTPQARERLVPRIRRWALDSAVGHATAVEIDRIGIIAALRLAAERAVSQLSAEPEWVLLDGNHDYLSVRDGLFDWGFEEPDRWRCRVPVRTLIKGDMKCSSIAAASVLAKTERDRILIGLAEQYPHYGFEENKAYSSPQHHAALLEHGPCAIHRCSWNLPGRDGWFDLPSSWTGLIERSRLNRLVEADQLPELLELPEGCPPVRGDLPGGLTVGSPMGENGPMMSAGIAR